MDEEGVRAPRQFLLSPKSILLRLSGIAVALVVVTVSLVVFTPVRQYIPGYGTNEIRQRAVRNAVKLAQLEDSLDVQNAYILQLRTLMTGGDLDTSSVSVTMPDFLDNRPALLTEGRPEDPFSGDERVGVAMPMPTVVADLGGLGQRYFEGVDLTVFPPVEGFVTRPIDSRIDHFGVDVAVPEGTTIRSVGDGYVVFADWTHEGGYALAIQHAKGYLSVYKHNQRLLKRAGDRVRSLEPIARSGNTGEVTTGPHLHFELWQNGLAQDPRRYFVDW